MAGVDILQSPKMPRGKNSAQAKFSELNDFASSKLGYFHGFGSKQSFLRHKNFSFVISFKVLYITCSSYKISKILAKSSSKMLYTKFCSFCKVYTPAGCFLPFRNGKCLVNVFNNISWQTFSCFRSFFRFGKSFV